MATLYEAMGGEDGLTAAITLFYAKVVVDERVARFFEKLDMEAQIDKQIAFMACAFEGPAKYTGRDLRAAHADLVADGLGDLEFDVLLALLDEALVELECDEQTRGRVAAVLEATRTAVLGRPDGELVFDRVIVALDGEAREMTVAEFRALSLRERVQLLIESAAEFRMGDAPVATSIALKSLAGTLARP